MGIEEIFVLIVDDVNAMRVQIKEILTQVGFKSIAAAANPEEAKALLARSPRVDLILSDWHMEVSTGLDFLAHLRSDERFREVPFILLTAENSRNAVIAALQLEVDGYVIKPLTFEQVQDKVLGVLRKKKVLAS
jgi:two-component system, chemotaxis family, chemotaxis protein CheY